MSHGDVAVRSVKLIYPIDHVRDCGQCLKPVQEAARNVDLGAELVIEQKRHGMPEGGRCRSGVDDDVEYGAVRTAHQLCLTSSRSTVQAAAYALVGP